MFKKCRQTGKTAMTTFFMVKDCPEALALWKSVFGIRTPEQPERRKQWKRKKKLSASRSKTSIR